MWTCARCGEAWATATVCSSCGSTLAAEAPARVSARERRFARPVLLVLAVVMVAIAVGAVGPALLEDRPGSGEVILSGEPSAPPEPTGPRPVLRDPQPQVTCDTDQGPLRCVRWIRQLGTRTQFPHGILETDAGFLLYTRREVWLVDRATGRDVWRVDVVREPETWGIEVAVPEDGSGSVFIMTNGHAQRHDLGTGEVTAQFDFEGEPVPAEVVRGGPSRAPGHVYLLSTRPGPDHAPIASIHAWRDDGLAWTKDLPDLDQYRGDLGIHVAADVVLISGGGQPVTGLDAWTGELRWMAGEGSLVVHADHGSDRAVGRSLLLIREPGPAGSDLLVAVEPATGARAWEQLLSPTATVSVLPPNLAIVKDLDRLTAFALTTGQLRWELEVHPREHVMAWRPEDRPGLPVFLIRDPRTSDVRGIDRVTLADIWQHSWGDGPYPLFGLLRGDTVAWPEQDRRSILVLDTGTGEHVVEVRTNAMFDLDVTRHLIPDVVLLFDDQHVYLAALDLPGAG